VWAGLDHDIVYIQGVSQTDRLQEPVLYIKMKKKADINICSEMSGFRVSLNITTT
jgi:hypothetical protein